MNLVELLAQRAQSHPNRIALVDASGEISYSDLYAKVCSGSAALKRDGLMKKDTVLLLLPVSIDLYVALLSVLHAGLTVMFLDPSVGKETMRHSLNIHKVTACISVPKAQLLRVVIPEIRSIKHHYTPATWLPFSKHWNPDLSDITEPPAAVNSSHPALITFTSGSTGLPKAACRTHGFLLAQHKALSESLDYMEGEVDLVTLPIFAISNLASGLTSVIADTDLRHPEKPNAAAILLQCAAHQVTRCAASPAFFRALSNAEKMPEFKAIYTGGAPVFPSLLEKIQSASPDMKVVTVFGSTEAEPISHSVWSETSTAEREKMLCGSGLLVGRPVSATKLRIIPDQSAEVIPPLTRADFNGMELPAGQAGEIVVTGDHVLKGYLNGTGDQETKFSVDDEIWHRTGDAAWRDTSGKIWLIGRCSAALSPQGRTKIYPFGVECAAMFSKGITRCALVMHQQKTTLCWQGELSQEAQDTLFNKLKELGVERIHQLTIIPVDKRHNAKIDYPALHNMLSKIKIPSESF